MRSVIDNAYIAFRSMRRRLQGTLWPPELDPLCAILVDNIWRNGSSIGIASLRILLALPASTLSTALRRLEDDGLIRRYQNRIDGRYVEVVLTRAGEAIAPALADLITEVESMSTSRRVGQLVAVLHALPGCSRRWTRTSATDVTTCLGQRS